MEVTALFPADAQAAEPVEQGDGLLEDIAGGAEPGAVGLAAAGDPGANAYGVQGLAVLVMVVATIGLDDARRPAGPAEATDRAVPGHWEGDLIAGAKNSHIATLVERHSRFLMLVHVKGKDTTNVVTALTVRALTLPDQMMKSLTWDRGTELAEHQRFTIMTDIKVYFCDPQSPWQRGSNSAAEVRYLTPDR